MTPERDQPGSFVNEVPENAEVRRVLGRSFAHDLAEPGAEREPVGQRDGFEFTVRIEPQLSHVVEKIGESLLQQSATARLVANR